jgi:hypothetical protein
VLRPVVFSSTFQIGIALPLVYPSPDLLEDYDHFAIVAIRDASYFFAATVGCMLIPRVVIWTAQEFCTINVVELDDLSSGPGNTNLLAGH